MCEMQALQFLLDVGAGGEQHRFLVQARGVEAVGGIHQAGHLLFEPLRRRPRACAPAKPARCRPGARSRRAARSASRRGASLRRHARRRAPPWRRRATSSMLSPRAARLLGVLLSLDDVEHALDGDEAVDARRRGVRSSVRTRSAATMTCAKRALVEADLLARRRATRVARLTVRLPRVTWRPTASRTLGSRCSEPGGRRRRTSRPRPLTLRTSQCQATAAERAFRARKAGHALDGHRRLRGWLAGRRTGSDAWRNLAAREPAQQAARRERDARKRIAGQGRSLLRACARVAALPARRWARRPAPGLQPWRSARPAAAAAGGTGSASGAAAASASLFARIALDLAPVGDRGVVLLQGVGEGVAAGAVGDEVEVRWCAGGLSVASIAERPGLQIGVGGRPPIW